MALNYKIFSKYIFGSNEKNFGSGTYDIRVEKIIDMKGKVHSDFTLHSQGMIVVICKEEIDLPDDVIGYATVKTRLAQEGIMTNNIGIIDPGYKGKLSSVIINYGIKPHIIKEGDSFLRLSFHKIDDLETSDKIPLKYPVPVIDYDKRRIREAKHHLGEDFLNQKQWVEKASKYALKKLIIWVSFFFGGILAAIGFFYTQAQYVSAIEREAKIIQIQNNYESRFTNLDSLLNYYRLDYGKLNTKNDSIKKELNLLKKSLKNREK